jgi:hypothetical protein
MFYVCAPCSKTRILLPSYSNVKEARICDRCVKEGIRKPKELPEAVEDDIIPMNSEATSFIGDFSLNHEDFMTNRMQSMDSSFNASLKGSDISNLSPVDASFLKAEGTEENRRSSEISGSNKSNNESPDKYAEFEAFICEEISEDVFMFPKYSLVQDKAIKKFLKIEESYEWKLPPAAILLYESSEELQKKMAIKSCKDCKCIVLTSEIFCGKCGCSSLENFNTRQAGFRVIWLLYCTELIYVSSLGLLANDLARDLLDLMIFEDSDAKKKRRNANLASKRFVSLTTDQATFMSSLSQLYTLHETFLRGILKYIQTKRFSEASLHEPLSQFIPFWGIYSDIFANFDEVRKLLKSNDFIEYLRSKSLSIDHVDQLLHFPLMRIQQYGPLIEEISKSIPEGNSDYAFTQECIQKIQEKIATLRANVTSIYQNHVLENIETEFDSDFLVSFPGRYLISRTDCSVQKLKVQGKKKKSPIDIHLLLFSDILIQAEYTRERKLVPFEITDLSIFMPASEIPPFVDDDEKSNPDLSIKLCSTEGVEVWFSFDTADTKKLWLNNINDAIEEKSKRSIGNSVANSLNNSGVVLPNPREHRRASSALPILQGYPSPSFKDLRCHNCKSFRFESQNFCSYCGVSFSLELKQQ